MKEAGGDDLSGLSMVRYSELGQRVLKEAPVVILVLDAEGRIQYVNPYFERLTGYQFDEVRGKDWFDTFLPARDHGAIRTLFRESLLGARVRNNVNPIVTRSGEEREIAWTDELMRDSDGNPLGLLVIGDDVTDRERAERELQASVVAQQRLVDELREVDRRKNEFIAMLSHELRNPLAAIRNGLYVLDPVVRNDDKASHATRIIERQTAQLTRLVDDLLDISRISRGKIQLQRVPLELEPIVRAAIDDHQKQFAHRGVQLETSFPGSPLVVNGDAARLTQVIGNLLNNAVKFTPSGGRTTVSLTHDVSAACAVLRVADTGMGIAPSMIDQVFQPFAQADRTLARSMGGLGLGLALVKGLVELHGGEASVRSEGEGRGTEVLVRLPLETVPVRTATPLAREPPPDSHRILVIEDNVDAAAVLRTVLELDGHVVAVAHDGAEGIRIAREFQPDTVLCDLGLPGLNGYDVARELKREQEDHKVMLVALSGYAAPEDVARSYAAGFDAHLAKPVTLERLRSLLWTVAPVGPNAGLGHSPG